MDVVKLRELLNNAIKSLIYRTLHELNLPHVKLSNTGDLETRCNLCGSLSLRLAECDINQLVRIWNLLNGLEIVAHNSYFSMCFNKQL